MKTLTTIKDWCEVRNSLENKCLGFVPTMGNLHEGHLALCERSLKENDFTVVSIFVNPKQFNEVDDFNHYPRTLKEDTEKLAAMGVDYLFFPSVVEMYADGFAVQVSEHEMANQLEGEHRPGHFTGMLTVVMKLLNLMRPSKAYFGEKDYQQLLLIQKMVAALFLPVTIVACETKRAEDGLALSSRNSRLSEPARALAAQFPALLKSSLSNEAVTQALNALGFEVDYIAEQWGRRLGAVWLDKVRLIDNVRV